MHAFLAEKCQCEARVEILEPRIAPAVTWVPIAASAHLFEPTAQIPLGTSHFLPAPGADEIAPFLSSPQQPLLSEPLAAAAATFPPVDGLTLTAAAVTAGFQISSFAKNFGYSPGSIGPLGVGFPTGSAVLVSDSNGAVRLFPTDTDGQDASLQTIAQTDASGITNLVTLNGKVYMSNSSTGELDLLNNNGTFKETIVEGMGYMLGLAVNPLNGHIFVSSYGNGIYDVNPVTKTFTLFNDADVDGIAIAPDGKTLYAAEGSVIGYDMTTKLKVFDSGPISGVDGTAIGAGTLSGFLFANANDGTVWQVDLKHPGTNTLIASGGTRGDFVEVDPHNGTLLLTQSNEIVRLIPPPGGTFGPTTETVFVGAGTGSRVQIFNAGDGRLERSFDAFESRFRGGVRVAGGDVNGDGIIDIITGVGTGGKGRVRVFDGADRSAEPLPIVDFRPFGTGYLGGVHVAAGDVNGDGKAELIVSTSAGSASEVRVFDLYDGLENSHPPTLLAKFKASSKVNGGVRVAAGDLDGDDRAEIVVTNGIDSTVHVFHGDGTPFAGDLQRFQGFAEKVGGLSAAIGDFDNDGQNDLALGVANGAAKVRVYPLESAGSALGTPIDFTAPGAGAGVRLAVADSDGDGIVDIVVGPATGSTLRLFSGLDQDELLRINTAAGSAGVFVA